ncbi:Ankyrin repeat, SAM and basic leucine zipper domain-containing protein 1 [Armadillidium vulgare]|nr:Ankyrin repeat, SAM and basic leucine zipper domain-containing protein 1 [Armadillidium vulgare]
MFRPAGMSDSDSDSDKDFVNTFPTEYYDSLNKECESDKSCDKKGNEEQNSDANLRSNQIHSYEGIDSQSIADSKEEKDINRCPSIKKTKCSSPSRPDASIPLNEVDNWNFSGKESTYSEKKLHLKPNALFNKGKLSVSPHRSPSNGGSKNWRRFRMHEGISLPLEEYRMAAMQGNIPVVKTLFTQGIAVDEILKSGWTALMLASSCGKHEMVQYLLQKGADPNMHKEMFTSLMAACASRQENEENLLKCVNHLLDSGANVNACERHRMTSLMFACKEGRVKIVERLISAHVDLNKQDNKGWTALCWAATKNHGIVVRKLLEGSADPSKMNIHGQRPSDIALSAGHIQLADILERAVHGTPIGSLPSLPSPASSDEKAMVPISKKSPAVSPHFGEMEIVLTGLELQDLIPLFRDNKITLECFLRLTENDLEKMGVKAVGTRKILLETIAHLHKQDLPDAVAMVANINRHLRFIHASVGHLRDQIQTRILELGQEKHNVKKLSDTFSDSVKNLYYLGDEIKFFKAHLDKVCNNVEYAAVDTIVIEKDDGKRWQRRIISSLVVATTIGTLIYFIKPKMFSWLFSVSTYPQKSVFVNAQ